MNETDLIESLKQKEDELNNLLNETKEKASNIKKDALRKAEEMKLRMSKDADAELDNYKKREIDKISKDVEKIKSAAIEKGNEIKIMDENIMGKAVDMVIDYIVAGNNR